ncbi:Uncharacterised protein [Bordetella pertussis]|nr:Uncharacterised protein [Bordetella pertussis]CPN14083.1 Uncharacterised protein [Bordetella pertussis]CPP16991.1 Uncharacterised protein [Bordetella pertussis]CPP80051.1 Uncharacterised protein [Bordetella pertussis]
MRHRHGAQAQGLDHGAVADGRQGLRAGQARLQRAARRAATPAEPASRQRGQLDAGLASIAAHRGHQAAAGHAFGRRQHAFGRGHPEVEEKARRLRQVVRHRAVLGRMAERAQAGRQRLRAGQGASMAVVARGQGLVGQFDQVDAGLAAGPQLLGKGPVEPAQVFGHFRLRAAQPDRPSVAAVERGMAGRGAARRVAHHLHVLAGRQDGRQRHDAAVVLRRRQPDGAGAHAVQRVGPVDGPAFVQRRVDDGVEHRPRDLAVAGQGRAGVQQRALRVREGLARRQQPRQHGAHRRHGAPGGRVARIEGVGGIHACLRVGVSAPSQPRKASPMSLRASRLALVSCATSRPLTST